MTTALDINVNRLALVTLRLAKRSKGTMGASVRFSISTNDAISTSATTPAPITTTLPAPRGSTCDTASTTAAMPTVMVAAPAKSIRWWAIRAARGRTRSAARTVSSPMGTLMNNTHRHEATSVTMPPMIIPAAAPPATTVPQTLSAAVRARPSAKVLVISDSAAGETTAAATPCNPRAAMSWPGVWARPHSREASANAATPSRNSGRRP